MTEDSFFDEFADDFFAESTDHLAVLRRGLLSIEESAQTGNAPAASLAADVARSLHTLKGLNGMVGMSEAAAVAHAMEDCMRHGAPYRSAPALEAMFVGTRCLEDCLAAYRAGQPAPDVSESIGQLEALSGASTSPQTANAPLDTPAENDRSVVRFTFMPSAELAARGVNVDAVRTRLQTIGEITGVTPHVRPEGSIAFELLVRPTGATLPDEAWRNDGISWEVIVEITHDAPALTEADHQPARANLVRVDLARLDDIMLLVGELVMSRARIEAAVARCRSDHSNKALNDLEEASEVLEKQLRDMRAAVMRVRLIPMGEVFERMRFVARDVANETGKQARIQTEGGRTEIDKAVVEKMHEPLLHLVRNAVSHGLESAAERQNAGKDPVGQIVLRAASVGDMIQVQVQDDGRGLDYETIGRLATERGIIDTGTTVDADNVLDILCAPGFSTRASADMASGRGVGMEVVRATVQELGGDLQVDSEAGRGTVFTIRLPLTLMIVDALLVTVGRHVIAVPQPSLREVLRIEQNQITPLENNEIIRYRDNVLPLIRLSTMFRVPAAPLDSIVHVLVVGNDGHETGLIVDRLMGLREIVVRPVADPLVNVPGIAGAAELSDGTITLIIDAGGVVRHMLDRKTIRRFAEVTT